MYDIISEYGTISKYNSPFMQIKQCQLDWSMQMVISHMKAEWRSIITTLGVQYVMKGGTLEMLMWCVECLDIHLQYFQEHQLTTEEEVVQCGCLDWIVQEERVTLQTVTIMDLQLQHTVVMVLMLVWCAQLQ